MRSGVLKGETRATRTPGGFGRRAPVGRRWVAALGAAALAALTAACGSGGSSGGSGQLQVYVYGDASVKVQEAAAAAFNKTSNVKVHLVEIPGSGYSDKLRAAMASPNAPDVFFNWGGGSIRDYVANNELLDLTPYISSDPKLKNGFLPSILKAGGLNGKDYGIPMRGMQPVILFYNKSLFAQYHLQPPSTWSAMQTAITTFKSKGVTPFALGGADQWPSLMWMEEFTDRLGGPQVFQRIESGDSSGWSDPSVVKAAQMVRSLVSQGAFGSTFGSVGYVDNAASTLFGTGRAAMHLMGSWEYSNQLGARPDFVKNDLGWVNFPAVPGGSGNPDDVAGNPTNYWSINAHTKYKDAAIAFVKTMADTSYAQKLIANGDVPTTTSAAGLLSSSTSPAYATFQYQMVQKAPSFQLSWDQALPTSETTPLHTEIGKLFAGQVSPQQFASDMEALKG